MGCQKHDGHPSVVAGPATLAVYSVLPARSAVPVIRTATAANVPFGRNVSVFHRRQLGLLGANAAAAMEVPSPTGGGAVAGTSVGLWR